MNIHGKENAKRSLVYVTYASGKYKANIFWNSLFVRLFVRPNKLLVFTEDDLHASTTYLRAKTIFDSERGGYYAWKPWAILEALTQGKEGDVVIYHDCGKGKKYKNLFRPKNIIEYAISNGAMPGVLVPIHGRNDKWTHAECFASMGCSGEEYYSSPQVEASISAWRVDSQSRRFLEEWLEYCVNLDAIRSVPEHLKMNQIPDFVCHRWDQSVLTNLVIKRQLKPVLLSFEQGYLSKSMMLVDLDIDRKSIVSKWLVRVIIKLYVAFKRT